MEKNINEELLRQKRLMTINEDYSEQTGHDPVTQWAYKIQSSFDRLKTEYPSLAPEIKGDSLDVDTIKNVIYGLAFTGMTRNFNGMIEAVSSELINKKKGQDKSGLDSSFPRLNLR